jgi:outer membrane protein TolC
MLTISTFAQESIIGEINYGLLEKYIEAARVNYPKRKLVKAQEDISKAGVTISQLSYLDIFSASYFYRPNDKAAIIAPGTVNPYIVNGIQYGININLGNFLQKPFLVKRAKAEYKVAQLQTADYDVSLVTEVKRRYYNYVQMLQELKIRTIKTQDNKSVADNSKRRFEKGEITLDQYNFSRIQLADASTERLQTEVNYLNAKDALEEIIGQKLTDIK